MAPRLNKGLRCYVYSYLTLDDLIKTICKLSKRDRSEIVESLILDQPRNLKIGDIEEVTNFAALDYYLSLVNGHFIMTLSKTSNMFSFNYIFQKVKALSKKNHSIKLSFELNAA